MFRSTLLTKFKSLNTELENLKERIEEENSRKSDIMRTLSKVQAETQMYRSKYETEGKESWEFILVTLGHLASHSDTWPLGQGVGSMYQAPFHYA